MPEAYFNTGHHLSRALAGSWRRSPPPFEGSAAELAGSLPPLLRSGAAALCWWRVRQSDLRTAPALAELQQAYRRNTLQAALHERAINRVVSQLRTAGIEPILVKGWAAARAYPAEGLRPCGDIDLCVRPGEAGAARAALQNLEGRDEVDLHSGFEKFGGGSCDDLYARALPVRLGEIEVRIPSPEDHLRILSMHLLREGAWRPLWLCDIAAAVEARPEGFNWNHCLGRKRRWSNWIICALRLAGALLGADISATPAAENQRPLPRWLVPTILKEWESLAPSMTQRHRAPMGGYWRHPSDLIAGFRHRWPNPIEATVSVRGSFNELPRLPFQIASYLARGTKFAARLPKLLRN